ncbi:MAG: GGDEF domain-containing protein [Ketobacteraceae bacterium]|nr:GGDEF domain-containing protein [Ketobacteraceae bacterium]
MPAIDNKKYFQVVDQLSDLRKAAPFGLAFKPVLEAEFQQAHGVWYRETIKAAALIAAVLLGIGHIIQSLAGVWVNPYAEWARFGAIGMLLLTCHYIARARMLTHQNTLVFINGMVCAAVIITLCLSYPAPYKHIFYAALVFVQVFMFGYIRMPFNQAFFTGIIIAAMANVGMYVDGTTVSEWAFLDFIIIAGTVLALMMCYRQEKSARENFLKMLLVSMERDQLKRTNSKLEERLSTDPVTHLLNRRAFEKELLEEWNRAFQLQRKSHLVAINIAQLKRLNELKGSEAGDTLLRSIARQVNQIIVEADDAAARISGGSFCLLVCNSTRSELNRRVTRLYNGLLNLHCLQDPGLAQEGVYLEMGVLTMEPSPEKDSRDAIIEAFASVERIRRTGIVAAHREVG